MNHSNSFCCNTVFAVNSKHCEKASNLFVRNFTFQDLMFSLISWSFCVNIRTISWYFSINYTQNFKAFIFCTVRNVFSSIKSRVTLRLRGGIFKKSDKWSNLVVFVVIYPSYKNTDSHFWNYLLLFSIY
jgi:hypothetical protein